LAPQTGFELITFWLTVIVLDYCELPGDNSGGWGEAAHTSREA
jgi:hypothetical protein